MLILALCGLAVGWRIHTDVAHAALAFAILLMFTFAMLWVGALIGLSVRSEEVAASAGLIWLFPVTFLSNCFVDPARMPSWMQPIAEWNPVSSVAAAVRDLFGNPNPFANNGFPSQHPVGLSLVYLLAITAVFSSLSVRKYQRATSR
ncbi:MAG: ABC transporter permease [Nocardioidaceae bacterium]